MILRRPLAARGRLPFPRRVKGAVHAIGARIYTNILPVIADLPDVRGALCRAGLDGIEVPCRLLDAGLAGGRYVPPEGLGGLSVSLHSDFADFNLGSQNPLIRRTCVRQLRAELSLAARYGFGPLTFHPGAFRKSDLDPSLRLFWGSLEEVFRAAGPARNALCLENMDNKPGKLCSAEEEISATLERFPALGLTVDLAHLALRGADIGDFLRAYDARIAHVHVSGFRPGERHGKVSLKGSVLDFRPFISMLKGRDVAFVIENATWDLMMESRGVLEEALR